MCLLVEPFWCGFILKWNRTSRTESVESKLPDDVRHDCTFKLRPGSPTVKAQTQTCFKVSYWDILAFNKVIFFLSSWWRNFWQISLVFEAFEASPWGLLFTLIKPARNKKQQHTRLSCWTSGGSVRPVSYRGKNILNRHLEQEFHHILSCTFHHIHHIRGLKRKVDETLRHTVKCFSVKHVCYFNRQLVTKTDHQSRDKARERLETDGESFLRSLSASRVLQTGSKQSKCQNLKSAHSVWFCCLIHVYT